MKKNDLAALLIIIVIAGVASYFLANAVIGAPAKNPVEVETVSQISPNFPAPDPRVFNDKAIDPTVEVSGDGQSSNQPFAN